MAHAHNHGAGDLDVVVSDQVGRRMWAAVAVCFVAVVVGLIVLWPGRSSSGDDPLGLDGDPVSAGVTAQAVEPCSYDPLLGCRQIELVPRSGDFDGERLTFEQPLASPIRGGDTILIDISPQVGAAPLIFFYDFERSTPLLLLLLVFVAAIVVLGRWRGAGALAGLAASLVVIVVFLLPALLEGSNAVAVALVAAGVIAFIALFLAHGFNLATAAALLASIASLAITAVLAWLFVVTSKLSGLADETVSYLGALGSDINPQGLLLAGVVIGSLGVLDDVTVTQVSAVWELKHAKPDADFAELYGRAVRIGRDHISSTVNTLFLAYAGASLPLLLLFREAGQSLSSVATREVVAVEVVRALVGSIGLVASVPISTALAAAVLGSRTSPAAVEVAPDQ
ncbi:MAG: YibE/F family protein [Ilumatobacter sp.]|uniref:YibE/F family protein n=1 Tax=Ilumatobacter sp. TaxID=1967498 RepID=UPI003C765C1C